MTCQQEALALLEDWGAMTVRQLARELGVPLETARSRIRGVSHVVGWTRSGSTYAAIHAAGPGVDVPRPGGREAVLACLDDGTTTARHIAERVGLTPQAVWYHLTHSGARRVGSIPMGKGTEAVVWGAP